MPAQLEQQILGGCNDARAGHARAPVKILHLTLKREWFDAIAAGAKTEEYRGQSPHWQRILGPHADAGVCPWTEIHFRNGYTAKAPFMRVACAGLRAGQHNGRPCYILSLGPVLEIKR